MSTQYDKDSIKTLSAIDHLRSRPGMWIGSTSSDGVLHLLSEVIDNSVDEFNEGRGNRIDIFIEQTRTEDRIRVRDYGNGIPVGICEDGGNTLTKVFTSLFTGGKFSDTYKSEVSGMNGVGVKAVNALSSTLKVTSFYNGKEYHQEFSQGKETTPIQNIGSTEENGTEIFFIPDSVIFKNSLLNLDDVVTKCKYLSSIKPGLEINLKIKEKKTTKYTFKDETELESILLEGRGEEDQILYSFSHFSDSVRVRLEYLPIQKTTIRSFCNTVYTKDGGYHEDSVISALLSSLKKLTGKGITKSVLLQGLNLVISVYKKNPIYRGQNKTRIADEDIKRIVYDEIYPLLYESLSKSSSFIKYISDICKAQERAIEESALKAMSSDIKSKSKDNQLPENLFIAHNCEPEKRELILCLHGDTEVKLLRGGYKKIKDLAEDREDGFWVYSVKKDGTFIPTLAHNPRITQYTRKTLKIYLSDNSSIECTTKHKFYDSGLNWIEAKDLKEGMSLYQIPVEEDEYSDKESLNWSYQIKSTISILVNTCLKDYKILNRENYYRLRTRKEFTSSFIPYELISNFFKSIDEAIEFGKSHSLEVIKVEEIQYDEKIPVYCLTVEASSHAFALRNGIISRNCEGASAGGSLAKARITSFQEVLPLRGKCLNLIKSGMARALENKEVKNIFLSVGGMEGTNTKLRTHNVYVMCFTGDTEVKMLDGTVKTFEELSEYEKNNPDSDYWVYSLDSEGSPVPGLGKNPRIIKHTNRICHIILDDNSEIKCTEDHKIMLRDGSYKEAGQLSIDDFLMSMKFKFQDAKNHTHKIKKIYIEELSEEIPVYCMTVEKYHNFVLNSGGIVVKNCDADADGKSIEALLESMFITAFPSFIKDYNFSVIKTALFCATDGKRRVYGNTVKQASSRFKKEYKSDKFYIQRNKGIGEMSPQDLRYFIDPKTRNSQRITLSEDSLDKMTELMGKDSSYRRAIMEDIDEQIYIGYTSKDETESV